VKHLWQILDSGFSNRKVESDFASKLMKKMGWNEGQGLGKNKNG
jgi:hypothetical protein